MRPTCLGRSENSYECHGRITVGIRRLTFIDSISHPPNNQAANWLIGWGGFALTASDADASAWWWCILTSMKLVPRPISDTRSDSRPINWRNMVVQLSLTVLFDTDRTKGIDATLPKLWACRPWWARKNEEEGWRNMAVQLSLIVLFDIDRAKMIDVTLPKL